MFAMLLVMCMIDVRSSRLLGIVGLKQRLRKLCEVGEFVLQHEVLSKKLNPVQKKTSNIYENEIWLLAIVL